MAYNNNIPQSTDRISDSQAELLANFQALPTYLGRNHVALSDPSGNVSEGKHIYLQMPQQGSAPATLVTEGAVYTKAVSGAPQLFYREQTNGTERQLTSAFLAATTGYYIIPGGLVVKWGVGSNHASGSTVTYDSTVPFTSAAYSINVSMIGTSPRAVSVSGSTTTGFTINFDGGANIDLYYMAIGFSS